MFSHRLTIFWNWTGPLTNYSSYAETPLTIFGSGWPRTPFRANSAAVVRSLWFAFSLQEATYEVINKFLHPQRGLPLGSGSVSTTSSAANSNWPLSRAADKSDDTTRSPRPTLIKMAPRRSLARLSALIISRVDHLATSRLEHRAFDIQVAKRLICYNYLWHCYDDFHDAAISSSVLPLVSGMMVHPNSNDKRQMAANSQKAPPTLPIISLEKALMGGKSCAPK